MIGLRLETGTLDEIRDIKRVLECEMKDLRKGYVRYSLHKTDADDVHVMVMLLRQRCSITPHCSTRKGNNFYMVLEGMLEVSEIDLTISERKVNILTEQSAPLVVDRTNWRILTNNGAAPCLYLEITNGPFRQRQTSWNWIYDLGNSG